ncbi:MAG TPA: hypothetical protein PK239_11265 [Chitinophagales bacterium]|nr:hypothetical protein [Chitinophagales bacterium]HRK27847.1 hypothetical protein [Chitinophagales bacterium]
MKQFLPLFALFLLIGLFNQACSSPKKSLHSGNYADAIDKSISKLRRDKTNEKFVLLLEEAYNKANARDMERIVFLKKEGKPDSWSEIYKLFVRLAARQEKVKPLLPLQVKSENRAANLPMTNYSEDMIAANQKAAEYLYVSSLKLIDSGSKQNIRTAYRQLLEVKRIYTNYKDTDAQIDRARQLGTNYVLLSVKNNSGLPVPPEFTNQLINLDTRSLDREWVQYHLSPAANLQYDYDATVNLQNISVSPEAYREQQMERSREIVDGWVYAQDAKGNFVLDSLGNKIKVDKFVRINCRVTRVSMRKEAVISGSLIITDRYNKQRLADVPLNGNALFDYAFAVISGDSKALDPHADRELISLCNNPPMSFPPDVELVMQSAAGLQEAVAGALHSKKSLLEK